jgi:hypothetical protein
MISRKKCWYVLPLRIGCGGMVEWLPSKHRCAKHLVIYALQLIWETKVCHIAV